MKPYQKHFILPGLSGQALADLLGVSRSLISHWLAGRRNLPEKASQLLLDLLQTHKMSFANREKVTPLPETAQRIREVEDKIEQKLALRLMKVDKLKKELADMQEAHKQTFRLMATLSALEPVNELGRLRKEMDIFKCRKKLAHIDEAAQRVLEERIKKLEG